MPLKLPQLYQTDQTPVTVNVFGGLNRALRIGDGQFSDMKNMTSDHYPVLATRDRRGKPYAAVATNPRWVTTAAVGNGGVYQPVWVDDVDDGNGGTVLGLVLAYPDTASIKKYPLGLDPNTEKQIVAVGAYLIVTPDMMYVNTVDEADYGTLYDGPDAASGIGYLTANMVMCDEHGVLPVYIQAVAPEEEQENTTFPNGILWQKTGEADGLYRWDDENRRWVKSATSYVKVTVGGYVEGVATVLSCLPFTKPLKAGDALVVSGMSKTAEGVTVGVTDGAHVVSWVEDFQADLEAGTTGAGQSFVLEGTLTSSFEDFGYNELNPVKVSRYLPCMDFVTTANNRLFGCRYGDNGLGSFVNEIYVSARGDFLRWGIGDGSDDGPAIISIGEDGVWSGAIAYNGYPTFFKERWMAVIGGDSPATYTVRDAACMGVGRFSSKSLAVVNNILYYKSNGPIMAYDGTAPVPVSEALGRLNGWPRAVGGAAGGKYYVSIQTFNRTDPHLYVLDTERGLWHREDATEAESMAADGENLYFVAVKRESGAVTRTLWRTRNEDAEAETDRMPWYAETGIIGLETDDKKQITKLTVKLHLEQGATARVSVQYDSEGIWKQVWAVNEAVLRTVSVPIVPMRCDHLKLRLEGTGGCRIYSITKTLRKAGQ